MLELMWNDAVDGGAKAIGVPVAAQGLPTS